MDDYIQISKLNDFIFCPLSLYFHSLYDTFDKSIFQAVPQIMGRIKHENIENGEYSTARRYIQGMYVFSEKYNLLGKIDIYDQKEKALIERKNRIKKIYDGYLFQLYAQMFCLEEMGYSVNKIFLHSLADNKRYQVEKPRGERLKKFEITIESIKNFDLMNYQKKSNRHKCEKCIYKNLCNRNI